jgi:molecular chaperone GrpE
MNSDSFQDLENLPESSVEVSSEKLESISLEEQVQDFKDRWTRAVAEIENIRKRTQKELEESRKFSISHLARDLLGIADNLSRALSSTQLCSESNTSLESFQKGIELIVQEFEKIFERHSIRKMNAKGLPFDPHRHQAICEIESDQPVGIVLEVFQEGYTLHERLLRPAMVSIAKSLSDGEESLSDEGIA